MSYAKSTWRLLITPAANGAWNMAVDEAILKVSAQNETFPTLRLYAWEPACLSIGYAQPSSDVDINRLKSNGWEIVRRPTGGRAILHTDELTYAVIAPHSELRLAGGVLESYQVLSEALLRALHLLNIPAKAITQPQVQADNDANGPICFEVPSNFEITFNGKKLIGSAQARKKEGILQHGSLPLYGDLARICQVLAFQDETERLKASERLLSHAITTEDASGRRISWNHIAQAFIKGFEETLNLELLPLELTHKEITRAQNLARDKYSSVDWTYKI
jgi:lipoate-protein ligase A